MGVSDPDSLQTSNRQRLWRTSSAALRQPDRGWQAQSQGFAHDVRVNIFDISKINSEVRGGKGERTATSALSHSALAGVAQANPPLGFAA